MIGELNSEGGNDNGRIRQLLELVGRCSSTEVLVQKSMKPKIETLNVMSINCERYDKSSTTSIKPENNYVKMNTNLVKKGYLISDFEERIKTNDNESIKWSLSKTRQG
jgi:hypothetical protein